MTKLHSDVYYLLSSSYCLPQVTLCSFQIIYIEYVLCSVVIVVSFSDILIKNNGHTTEQLKFQHHIVSALPTFITDIKNALQCMKPLSKAAFLQPFLGVIV